MSLKVGLIARCEERGLGIQTKAFYDHMNPARTMVVVPETLPSNQAFEQNYGWYPDATIVRWDNKYRFDEPTVRAWLDGLDVVVTCETFYDWRIVDWAKQAGVATVCQVNPEFYQHARNPNLPNPTVWWAPTTWRLKHLPADTRVVGVPVDVRPRTAAGPYLDGPLKLVHVVGRKAVHDRNGTDALVSAIQRCHGPIELTIHIQDGALKLPPHRNPGVNIHVRRGSVSDRWTLYEDQHLFVLPRRFGGLCLGAQEAAACGLGLVMADISPNNTFYPATLIPMTTPDRDVFRSPGGDLLLCNTHPTGFRDLINDMADDRMLVSRAQSEATEWAKRHSWPSMKIEYDAELDHAANLVSPGRNRLFRR